MKITCLRQTLVEAVMNVQRAVSTKSCLTVLEGILIATEQNAISLCGYDLELGITTKIPATVEESGKIVINAKLLAEIIRKAPAETVTISVDQKLIATIVSGPAKFSLVGISWEDFPEIPELPDKESLSIDSEILKGMIRQTLFATSESDVKPINTGTLFEVSEEELKAGKEHIDQFLSEFFKNFENIEYFTDIDMENSFIRVNINGNDAKTFIGYRGEVLNSLQNVLNAVSNKYSDKKLRIILNVSDYRQKREKSLEELADKVAKTVFKTGKSITLEPMMAYERKIIHNRLQKNAKVITHSVGEEPYRKVVIEKR